MFAFAHAPQRQCRPAIWLVAALFVFMLPGCSQIMDSGLSRKKERSLAESSYAAADMLLQQSRSFMTPQTALAVGVLSDLDKPGEATNFGRMVTSQIASRFVQLGYNVSGGESAAPGAGIDSAGAASPPMAKTGAVIGGTYAVARNDILVNLRILDAASGKVLAAYDYPVPRTRDVSELVKTGAEKSSIFDF